MTISHRHPAVVAGFSLLIYITVAAGCGDGSPSMAELQRREMELKVQALEQEAKSRSARDASLERATKELEAKNDRMEDYLTKMEAWDKEALELANEGEDRTADIMRRGAELEAKSKKLRDDFQANPNKTPEVRDEFERTSAEVIGQMDALAVELRQYGTEFEQREAFHQKRKPIPPAE